MEWISVYVTVTSKLEQKLYIAPLQLDWPTNNAHHVLCAVLFMNTELHLNNSQSSGMILHDAGEDCWMTDIAGINESNLNCGRRHRHHSTIVSRPTFQRLIDWTAQHSNYGWVPTEQQKSKFSLCLCRISKAPKWLPLRQQRKMKSQL